MASTTETTTESVNTLPSSSSCCTTLRPYDLSRETYRQIKRSPISWLLGLFTCLLTVITASTMQSLLGASPAVFLRQAESGNGQVDVVLSSDGTSLNFTAITSNVKANGETKILAHMSARSIIDNKCKVYTVPLDRTVSDKRFFISNTKFIAMDTVRDQAAGIGRNWTLPPLEFGETWVTQRLANALDLKMGDTIDVEFFIYNLLSRYITLNDQLTDFFTLKSGTRNVTAQCRKLDKATGAAPRSNDPSLVGSVASKCVPGSRTTLFCGPVSDGSRCGMKDRATVRLKIAAVINDWGGRLPGNIGNSEEDNNGGSNSGGGLGGESMLAIEISHLMELTLSSMPIEVNTFFESIVTGRSSSEIPRKESLKALSYDSVTHILVNLPANERNNVLLQNDYSSIQDGMVDYSGRVLSSIGAIWLRVENPILVYLRRQRFTTLYLGMVMDILIAILLGLSSVLIYSLMMINVQGRQFELAVRRMLGATKIQVIALLGVQSMSFAVPSVIIGLPTAHLLTMYLFTQFNEIAGVTIQGGLTATGANYGIVLGLFIPILGAIGPIQNALGVELREALDITRSKTKVIEYDIESEQDRSRISSDILAVGGSLSIFGFLVYYLLPLALLSLDLRLFFLLFVCLLLGMLVGLVLLASNLQGMVEYVIGQVFLFWARPVLKKLALKNLIAHRKRNWKTSIMYSLSLAFIIFIAVASQMELQTFKYDKLRDAGT